MLAELAAAAGCSTPARTADAAAAFLQIIAMEVEHLASMPGFYHEDGSIRAEALAEA